MIRAMVPLSLTVALAWSPNQLRGEGLAVLHVPGDAAVEATAGTHGHEFGLPLCSAPDGFQCTRGLPTGPGINPYACGLDNLLQGVPFLIATAVDFFQTTSADMDWGGENILFGVPYVRCQVQLPGLEYDGPPQEARVVVDDRLTIAQTTGYIDHVSLALVRATLEIHRDATTPQRAGDVILAIQTHDGVEWRDVTTRAISTELSARLYELQAYVSPGVEVRFQVRAAAVPKRRDHRGGAASTGPERVYLVRAVRMFGAQCYPDFANPGDCL